MAGLAGAKMKLDRAEEHLRALDDEIAAYLDREPYKTVLNIQPSDPCTLLIEFHVIEQPPDRLSVTLGDCVHNLRSSLDHVVFDLVAKSGGVGDRTQFPIVDSMLDKNGKPKPSLTVGGPIQPRAMTLIDRLQPHQRGQDAPFHPLAILRELSNIDKHQTVHIVAAQVTDTMCFLRFPDGTFLGGQLRTGVTHDQTPFGVFPFSEPFDLAANPDIEVEGGGSVFVAIGQPGPWADRPVAPLLEEILQFVRHNVVAGLEPFLN